MAIQLESLITGEGPTETSPPEKSSPTDPPKFKEEWGNSISLLKQSYQQVITIDPNMVGQHVINDLLTILTLMGNTIP